MILGRPSLKIVILALIALFLACVCQAGAQDQPVLIPGVKGPTDKNGSDYTSTTTTRYDIPQTFPEDKSNDLHLITAWKSRVEGLGSVAIVYFRIMSSPITDTTLNAQVTKLWHHFTTVIANGPLDVFILRGVNSGSTCMYSYIYRKGTNGKWFRNRDGDYVNKVIQAGI